MVHSAGILKHISPTKISPNPENPRMIFRQEEMETLLVSIDKLGIQVPLAVYKKGDTFNLIDGERRWRCATKLNMKTVPVLIQEKPTPLQNLLLMYNIHALREQWDYYTIASKLTRVIELFIEERKYKPNEIQLSEATGLTRGQIRRCKLLLDLPNHFKDLLLKELELPKAQQKISEDFFIEMERSLKTVVKRIPEYKNKLDPIRETLISKFRAGTIQAVTDFRSLSKIATAVDNLGKEETKTRKYLDKIFDPQDSTGIREVYEETVGFEYGERKAQQQIDSLTEFFDQILEGGQKEELDPEFKAALQKLYRRLKDLLS